MDGIYTKRLENIRKDFHNGSQSIDLNIVLNCNRELLVALV